MGHSFENSGTNFKGRRSPKTTVTTDNLVDFTSERARRYTVKDLQRITGLSKKQVENIRQGKSGISGVTLSRWIMGCTVFAGDYAEWTGLIRPGEAGTAAALTRLVNEIVQREARGK